jgi:hypothetical protein
MVHNPRSENARVYCAGVILGATSVAAVWLYTYRSWRYSPNLLYVDENGQRHFRGYERLMVQPWWSVYAAVALVLIGTGVSLWLLPEGQRLVKRFAARFTTRLVEPS